jgi:hypothetical protein
LRTGTREGAHKETDIDIVPTDCLGHHGHGKLSSHLGVD